MMKRLFVFDYFRGTDSTGLAAISPKGDHRVVKRATHPLNLFDSKEFNNALDGRTNWAFLGHNRAATLGAVNDANAHPFKYGDIIGAHNGTIDKASWRRLEEASGVDTNVDSAAIFACINAIGIDETIALMEHGATSTTGAWALVWYDDKDNTLRFLKNKHRPLFLCVHEKGDRIAWASEWIMIRAAEEMTAGWESKTNNKGFSYFPLEDDYLYEFPLDDLMGGFTIEKLKASKVRKIQGREPAPVTVGSAPFQVTGKTGPTTENTGTGGSTTTATNTGGTNDDDGRVVHLVPITGDPFGGVVTDKEFEDLSNSGHCTWCGTEVTLYDKGLTVYPDEDVVLCKSCTSRTTDNKRVYLNSERMKMYV